MRKIAFFGCFLLLIGLTYYLNILFRVMSVQMRKAQPLRPDYNLDDAYGLDHKFDDVFINSFSPEEEVIFKRIEDESSLPLLFGLQRNRENLTEAKTNVGCRLNFPNIYTLHYHNTYWQEVFIRRASFFLLSAFFDDRVKGHSFVRIMVVTDRVKVPAPFCQIWHKRKNLVTISTARVVRMYQYIEDLENYRYVSQIVSCPLAPGVEPEAVSLVENRCDQPRNALRVVYNKVKAEKRQDFLVCYKALHHPFDDRSQQFVEWFEFLKMMGVNKVHFHILDIHPNIKKVFDYYKKQGLVETRDISLPGYLPNLPGLQHIYLEDTFDWNMAQLRLWEHLPMTDCLYRNMFKYKYIIVQDTDEVLIPINGKSYRDMLKGLEVTKNHSHVYFDNFHHYDQIEEPSDVPRFMYMMSRVYRRGQSSNIKSFYNPLLAGSGHSHKPLNCINDKGDLLFDLCNGLKVERSVAFWHNYPSWPDNKVTCDPKKCAVIDESLWRYKDKLIDATNKTINDIFN